MRYIALPSSLVLLFGLVGCDAADGTIGPRGGMIVSDDGLFSLEVPEGAIDHEMPISIETVDCAQQGAVGPCYVVEPRGTSFSFPARVTYELAGAQFDRIDPAALMVFGAREDGWSPLADRVVDLDDQIVSASALYTTEFALVALD